MSIPAELERHNEVQRRYYGGELKRRMLPTGSPYVMRQLDRLIAFAALAPGARVLEIGCGMGRYTLPLLERGFQVEGIDLSPVQLERMRAAAGDVPLTLHCGDVAEPPEGLRGPFDAVIGFFVLHHVHRLDLCFRAIHSLLAPGGRAAFLEPNPYNPLYYLQIFLSPDMTWEGDKGIVHMRRGPLFRAMETAGLSGLRQQRFGFFPPAVANRAWAPAVESSLERFPPWRPLLPFQLFGSERR